MIPPRDGVAASITASSQDLPPGRRTPSRDPLGFRLLSWSTVAVAVAALSISVAMSRGEIHLSAGVFAGWTALVAITSVSSVSLGHDIQLTFDMPVLLAAAFIFGPVVAGLMGLLGSFEARELKRRVTLSNALFNHAQVCLSV